MVLVKYFNGMENTPQFTKRTVRKLVKLWSVDDISLADDIAEMTRKFGAIQDLDIPAANAVTAAADNLTNISVQDNDEHQAVQEQLVEAGQHVHLEGGGELRDHEEVGGRVDPPNLQPVHCKTCCCESHHQYSLHYTGKKYLEMQAVTGEGVGQGLAVAYAMATNCDKVGSKQGDLEELMMTVGVNVDYLM